MEQVVLVHGAWVRSFTLSVLARRLRVAGFETHLFDYQTRPEELFVVAERLRQFIASRSDGTLHVVAHSLGGLVVQEVLARHPEAVRGRIVLLGSPVNGSRTARQLTQGRVGRAFLGKGGQALAGDCRYQARQQQTGIIAGSRSIGLGRLLCRFDEPNDGSVAVSETRLPGRTADLVLPVTHTGLPFSGLVAQQVIYFLSSGEFRRDRGGNNIGADSGGFPVA